MNQENANTRRDQLVTIGDLDNLKEQLLSEIKVLVGNTKQPPLKQWLRSAEVRRLLGISYGTLQNFRVNGTLSFTKIGGIVFYKYGDILQVLERNSSQSNGHG